MPDPTDPVNVPRRRLLASMGALAAGANAPVRAWNLATPAPSLRAQRLAWAGVRLTLGPDDFYIDPLMDPIAWGSALADPLSPIGVGSGRQFAAITHRHPDHFDPIALRHVVGESGVVVCTPENAAAVAAAGFKPRVGGLYEPILLNDFTVIAVPAADGYGDPQVSWVVRGGGRRIIHCGDTLWHGAWWHIGRALGPFDAAFLPINGARFSWRKPVSEIPAVLTPEQAVAAAQVLGARVIVPIHYGVEGAEGYAEAPDPQTHLLDAARRRGQRIDVVAPGQWVTWDE